MRQYLKGYVTGAFIASLISVGVTTFSLNLGKQAQITPQGFPIPTKITPGNCTGCTVLAGGDLIIPSLYKVQVGTSGFITASTTSGITIAVIPAKMRVAHAYADLTQVYACASTCTSSTLSLQVGLFNNGAFIGAFDADAATGQFALGNTGLGSNLNTTNANAGPFGVIQNWSATTNVTLAMISGTGNVGTGAATNLSQGSVTIYLLFVPTS